MRIRLLDDNLSARSNELARGHGAGTLRRAGTRGTRVAMCSPVRPAFGGYYTVYSYSFPCLAASACRGRRRHVAVASRDHAWRVGIAGNSDRPAGADRLLRIETASEAPAQGGRPRAAEAADSGRREVERVRGRYLPVRRRHPASAPSSVRRIDSVLNCGAMSRADTTRETAGRRCSSARRSTAVRRGSGNACFCSRAGTRAQRAAPPPTRN